jgi:hypothetical protein
MDQIGWHPTQPPRGGQRIWRVDIVRSWWRRDALPLTWEFGGFVPTTLATRV